MARTYSSIPVLSKIKIGETTYYLKDGDARALLDSIDSGIWAELLAGFGTIGTVGDEDKLVKASDIKSYVDSVAEAALEFVVLPELPDADADAWEEYHNCVVLVPKAVVQPSNAKEEYIIMRSGTEGAYTYAWEKIGDTDVDLRGYVTNVSYVDAVHKLQQTKNGTTTDVHEFGALADADQAETTLADYVTGVSSAKVTAAGALKKDSTKGVQISGSIGEMTIIDSVGSAPSFSEGKFTPNVPTAIDVSKFNGGSAAALNSGFYTAGSAAQFTEGAFTANVPTALDLSKFNGGSKVADTYVAPELNTLTKALYKQGVKAEVGTGANAETLIFTNVDKEADIKVVDTFSAGSFTEGAFTAASLASGFYTPGSAASKAADSFTANTPAAIDVSKFDGGQAASLGAGFYTAGSAASKVADSWNAGAVPTTKSFVPSFTGDKFAFEGSEVDATVTLAKGSKNIVVDPKNS